LKLDELIRANEHARNAMLTLEDLTEDQLKRLKDRFAHLADVAGVPRDKLQDVREDLDEAGEGLEQAQEKIAAVKTAASA
jgi:hypothetical protein